MITVTVMYPNGEDAYFDMDYYQNKHIPMVKELCGVAIKDCSVEQALGEDAPGPPAPYRVICRLSMDSMDDFVTYMAPHDPAFAADVPNYTNIVPVMQITEVIF
jgi:uncharacterized protein (TIGR02118 family)